MAGLIAEETGQPIKLRAGGRLTASLLGLFVPDIREMKEMMYEFEEPYIVDHSHFEAVFGNDTTPHQEAIGETIAWYQGYLDN